jgi:dihydrofolate reductase
MLAIVVAMDKNNGIGKNNTMPWHFKKDMKYFKELTWGHPVVMGRKTFDSLPTRYKPLPGRENIIITRKPDLSIEFENVKVFNGVKEVLKYCKNKDCFVVGGGQVYNSFLPFVDKLFITYIEDEYGVDTYFPKFDINNFDKVNEVVEEENGITLRFVVLERKNK